MIRRTAIIVLAPLLAAAMLLTIQSNPILAQNSTGPSFRSYQYIPQTPLPLMTLRFATLEWPPYISSVLPQQGYVARLLREVFLPAGYSVEIIYLPWQRAVHALSRRDIAGYLPEYFDEHLKENPCLFSDPFPGGPLAFVHKSGRSFRYKTLADLRQYQFGVVAGYVNYKEFDDADYLKKDFATDDLTNLRKLLADRVSLIIGDPLVINYLYNRYITPGGNQLQVMYPFIEEKPLHICFNQDFPDVQTVNALFSEKLRTLKESGQLGKLHDAFMKTHLPRSAKQSAPAAPAAN